MTLAFNKIQVKRTAFSGVFFYLFLPLVFVLLSALSKAQPLNDNCANASAITIGSGGFALGNFTSTQFDMKAATLQTNETFAPSIVVAGLNKKSTWYKFSIPTTRSISVSLLQPGSTIQAGNVGFTVYKSNSCLPGNLQISTELSPIETFGKTFHPCVYAGDYLVQVSGNNEANGPIYIMVEVAEPSPALYDKPAGAQKFGKVSINKVTAADFDVKCQSIENAAENCMTNGSFRDYTKSSWHTLRTPDYFDWFAVMLSESNPTNPYAPNYVVGYRLYEGDATTTPVASLPQIGGCDSIVTNGYYPDWKLYKCGQLKANTTYTIQLLYHKDFERNMRLALAWDGDMPAKGPMPVTSLPIPNKMGILKADATSVQTLVSDYFACNSRHSANNCPRSIPVKGVMNDNGYNYNLSTFYSFTLATSASLTIYASVSYCGPGTLVRLYKQNLTASCADLDTSNIVESFISYNYKSIPCLAAGNYVLQVLGSDTTVPKNSYAFNSLTTSVENYLCLNGQLGRKVEISIQAKTEVPSNKFSLSAAGRFDKINIVAGVMQPLKIGSSYNAVADTFGCANTVLPDDNLCGPDTTKAVFREFVVKDSAIVSFTEQGHYMKLYKGDANALALAQNKVNFPQRITGLTPYSNCIYWWYCDDRNTCVTPGTYTLISLGGQNQLGNEVKNTITITQPKTKHFAAATAQNMGNLWDSAALTGSTYFYSDEDTFTCRDNPATIGGFEPCAFNGKAATKLIYRQFYLSEPSLITISLPYIYNCNYSSSSMTLFTGKATDGIAGLKPVGDPWNCFSSVTITNQCVPLPAGWYTVVSYGYGPSFADPLQGMTPDHQTSDVGRVSTFYIFLAKPCTAPSFNRPHKASIDTITKKPYLIQWGPQPEHTAAYPVTYKRNTLNTEYFNCTEDTSFIRQYMNRCHPDNVKVAFYVFETTQESFVQIEIPDGLWGAVYDFDVRTKDSTKLKTSQPLQTCLNKETQIQICKLKAGKYTLVFFAPAIYNCHSVTPTIYIDQVGYSRFDHANKAYDFGAVRPDSTWHNGKLGEINPLSTGRAASNDFFYCTTGAQETDPPEAVCGTQYNPAIYATGNSNIVLHPDNANTPEFHTIDRRNLWYTFTVNQGGTVRIKVDNKTPGKIFQYPFAVYQSDVDGSLPFASVVAAGSVDSTLLQGLTFIKNNNSYTYCEGLNEISLYNDPCYFKPIRYYIQVENRNSYWYGNQMYPNHQVEVSILLDSVNAIQPKFDHYSQASNMGVINSGKKKGATDNFSCATRDLPDPVYGYDQCNKTLWYKFTTTTTGQIRYRVYYNNQSQFSPDQVQLFRQISPGDSTNKGLEYLGYTSVPYINNEYWAERCITTGTYYIILPGCNTLNEDVYPEIEIIPQAGDFCSAPMVSNLNGPGSKVVSVTVDCHTIGTDYGEFNPELTCPAGGITADYKSSWYRLDIGGKDTLDVTVYLNEKTNASSTEIKYRMMTGNCGAMQEQSCVQDALTRNTYKCLAPGNSYYIQVFTPLSSINPPYFVTGDIDLNISSVTHADTCLPANNCIAVANFTPQFDCTKDRDVVFTNFSTYGSAIKYDWNFGYNNQKSSAVSPRFFYPALTTEKTYTVKLVVTNTACGKKDSIVQTVSIPARPSVNLGNDTVICKYGSTVNYDVISHPGSTYYWYNGSTESQTEWSGTQSPWVEITYKGCIARDTVNIWINPIDKPNLQTLALCHVDQVTLNSYRGYGEQYKWSTGATISSISVSQPGYYWCDLYLNGCIVRDSFLVVSTSLKPLGDDIIICQAALPYTADATVSGASNYTWQDGSGSAAYFISKPGLYWVDINLSECIFRDTLLVKVDSFKTATTKASICLGQKYKLPSGKMVSVTATYRDSLKNSRGCDSLITTVTLTVDTVRKSINNVSICGGQSYTLPSGRVVTAANAYIDTIRNSRGCDSIISTTNLSVATVFRESRSITICKGGQYKLPSGKNVFITGVYADTLKAKAGCDSLITTVDLKVLSPIVNELEATVCYGKAYILPSGKKIDVSGLYKDTLRYANGCDSLISVIMLTVGSAAVENKKAFICSGQQYMLPSGRNVTITGIYKDTVRSAAGCDIRISTIDLTVQPVSLKNSKVYVCRGSEYLFPSGKKINTSGVYQDTLYYSTGCDSVINVVDLIVYDFSVKSSSVSVCFGQEYKLPGGRTVVKSGLYRDTIRYVNGCDSLISNITLNVGSVINENKKVFICDGQTYTLPGGRQVAITNIYKDTVRNTAGCDSMISTIDLTVQLLSRKNSKAYVCKGSQYLLPSGKKLNTSGIYSDTLYYSTGCDSVINVVDLTVYDFIVKSNNVSVCFGQEYKLPGGRLVGTSGLYRDTMRYVNGCDSLISNITLNVGNIISENKKVYICEGQQYVLPSGGEVSATNIYKDTVRNAAGCDSLISTIDLTVQSVTRKSFKDFICNGNSYILPSGKKINTAGIYRDTLHYKTGCDSSITVVDLSVYTVINTSINATICSGKSYMLPSGKLINTNGLHRDTVRYANGCDSLISAITLNINEPVRKSKTEYICLGNTYPLPSGRIVSVGGVYKDTLYSSAGCDSLINTIALNVDSPEQRISNAAVCKGEAYTLPSGRQVFNSAGYLDTLINRRGCDSIHFIINLKTNEVVRADKSIIICKGQSHILPLGKVVTNPGIYHDTLKTITGCDSIITTTLTVRPLLSVTLSGTKIICAGNSSTISAMVSGGNGGPYTYSWTGGSGNDNSITVNPNITTKYKLTVSDGCTVQPGVDSITINVIPIPDATIKVNSKSGCEPLKVNFNNNTNGVKYHWDFGTGTTSDTSSLKSPSFIFNQPGSYLVKLTLTTPEGCSSSSTEDITVSATPVSKITAPLQICAGNTADIKGQVSNASNIQWNWNFGNGDTSDIQDPVPQVYNTAGNYTIRLITKNATGCADTVFHELLVAPVPVPGLGGGELRICAGNSTILVAQGGASYVWTPANSLNNAAIGNPVAHPLFDTRYYVQVINAGGCSATDSIMVRVTQHFTLTTSQSTFVCAGAAVDLQANGASRYEWTGPGIIQNTANTITVKPASTAMYTVTGYGPDNCFNQTANIQVTVIPLPTVEAGRDTVVMVGSSFSLLPVYSSDVSAYSWTPSTYLDCNTCPFPIATPREPVVYTIVVRNNHQCEASDTKVISLLCNNESVFVPNTFTPNGDGVNDIFYPRGNGIKVIKYLRVYNRWGQLIFERRNFNTDDRNAGWNGTFKGQLLPPDVYVYSLSMVCDNSQTVETKGNIMIAR